MYVPRHFQFEGYAEKIAFMQQYSFATIVSIKNGIPIATQLPFHIRMDKDQLILTSHFARANEQADYIKNSPSLVIFSEPHAYISPQHYDKEESVPTWDYIAVHAYGLASILTDEQAKNKVLEQMILSYDEAYLTQWNELSDRFKSGMMRGIVAFELVVTDLQGQKKLSQNKSETERQRISDFLKNSDNELERNIAAAMKNGSISSEKKMNTNTDIEITQVKLTDIDLLQEIGKATFIQTFSDTNTEENMNTYLAEGFSNEKLLSELCDNESEFYFAVLKNDVIGYLKVNTGQAQTEQQCPQALEIERIYVLQEFHGRKVGQLLFEKALALAQIKAASFIWLGVWEKNLRAINFYQKNGFVAFDQHIFQLGDDKQIDIMMKKNITALP
ncbi:GNAT family N-acetyltransferase [Sphingobacterium sp.]|uniref:GNAT family N-acetyltransferase n=1 Tax=Sphingobacterium sp. TaxID=341027 RepID=UPI0028A63EAB|nr:GNAT family N-acetyltransferase [Sphingobacterium sp.]